jgi:hypothetical protein
MTKRELIKALEGLPDNTRITVGIEDGRYEGGLKDITEVEPVRGCAAADGETGKTTNPIVQLFLSEGYLWEEED